MTPKERFNQEVWFVLNKIKKYSFYAPQNGDVEYRIYSPPDVSAEGMPFPVEQMRVIDKLVEWGAVKIKKPNDRLETAEIENGLSGAMRKFIVVMYLEVLQPKFDKLYRHYEDIFKRDVEKRLTPTNSHTNIFDWEKLKIFKDKINNAIVFDDYFRQLIGIELFDFIQANSAFKNEFNKRLNYLKNLVEDKGLKLLQDNLFKIIQRILKLTSLQEVQKKQKEWNNEMGNRLKTRRLFDKNGEKENISLTLPELYLDLQKKDNYYRLGDDSYFSPMEGEISIVANTHIVPIKKQYEINVEGFFKLVFFNKFTNDDKRFKQYEDLVNEYNKYWYELEELIYRIPIKLHFQNFEGFFFDCVKFYPRQGYEFYHSPFGSSVEQKTEKKFEKIKENAIVVIDDLIETLKIGMVDKKVIQSQLNPINDDSPIPRKARVMTLEWAIVPIKSARLDEQNYFLEINNGEKIISFKSKKKGEGLEKETKQFKILFHLWEFRWELKNDKFLKKGEFITLDNLAKGGRSDSAVAAYKHIQRLNKRFKKEGVAIEIKGENERYRLIIYKA